jgi:hypothetical protein
LDESFYGREYRFMQEIVSLWKLNADLWMKIAGVGGGGGNPEDQQGLYRA